MPSASVAELAAKTKTQKGIKITHTIVPSANHFFAGENKEDLTANLADVVGNYVDERMIEILEEKAKAER